MAKMIKFDLLINGNKVKNLEELQDNFTFEVVAIARSGRLTKWLLSRDENKLADKVKSSEELTDDIELFKVLATVFGIKANPEVICHNHQKLIEIKICRIHLDPAFDSTLSPFIVTSSGTVMNKKYTHNCIEREELFLSPAQSVTAISHLKKKSKKANYNTLDAYGLVSYASKYLNTVKILAFEKTTTLWEDFVASAENNEISKAAIIFKSIKRELTNE